MKLRTTSLWAALAVVVGSGVGQAEPIDTTQVPADSNWVVHVDFDAARKSTIAERLRTNDKFQARLTKGFGWLEKRYGIARGDMHGLTMYGATYEENRGIALLAADYDLKKVERIIQDEPGYRSSQHGKYTLHTWSARDDDQAKPDDGDVADEVREAKVEEAIAADDAIDAKFARPADDAQPKNNEKNGTNARNAKQSANKTRNEAAADDTDREATGANRLQQPDRDTVLEEDAEGDDEPHHVTVVFLEGMIVMGGPEALVRETLDRKVDANARTRDTVLDARIPAGAIVFGTARNFEELGDRTPDLRIVAETERLTLAAGEAGGQLFASLQVEMGDEEIATELRDVAEGLRAITRLAVREARAKGEELPFDEDLLELLSLDVKQTGGNVAIRWQADSEQFVEAVESVMVKFPVRFDAGEKVEVDVDVEKARDNVEATDEAVEERAVPPTNKPTKRSEKRDTEKRPKND